MKRNHSRLIGGSGSRQSDRNRHTCMTLYTKTGRPLQVHGDKVYSNSGVIVGRIKDDRVYGTDGRYVGTIVGDRLVYRSTHSAKVFSSFGAGNRGATGLGNRGGSGLWREEPNIPD